jgi:hypothetical protein
MCPFFEDDDDPKKPRPITVAKKRSGAYERGEARKDYDRDHHRHVRL